MQKKTFSLQCRVIDFCIDLNLVVEEINFTKKSTFFAIKQNVKQIKKSNVVEEPI